MEKARGRTRRRRVLKVLAGLVIAWLVADKAVAIVKPAPTVGHWRSQDGYRAYRAAYDAVMDTMPKPTRTHEVRTSYGSVRVYEWTADADAPTDRLPVVMVPGIRSGAPMWNENLRHWLGKRTLYTMDAVGDAGLSTQAIPLTSYDDQGHWVEEVLAGLQLDRVHMLGHSFGGATATIHSLRHPKRVASLTLLEPVMVLHGLPASTYLWSTMLLLPVPQSWKDRGLAEIGGTSVAEVRKRTPMSVMIDEGSKHYSSVTVMPRTLTDEEWQSMPMPIRTEIASDKSLTGGTEAAERAKALKKGPVTVRPNTTHSLPMQAADILGPELEQYWEQHDR